MFFLRASGKLRDRWNPPLSGPCAWQSRLPARTRL